MKFQTVGNSPSVMISSFFAFSSVMQALLLFMWRALNFMIGFGGFQGFYISLGIFIVFYVVTYIGLEFFYVSKIPRRILMGNFFLATFVSFFFAYLLYEFPELI